MMGFLRSRFFAYDPVSNTFPINAFIGSLTSQKSGVPGSIYFEGDLIGTDTRINAGGLDAKLRLRVYNAYIKNLLNKKKMDMISFLAC